MEIPIGNRGMDRDQFPDSSLKFLFLLSVSSQELGHHFCSVCAPERLERTSHPQKRNYSDDHLHSNWSNNEDIAITCRHELTQFKTFRLQKEIAEYKSTIDCCDKEDGARRKQ